MCCKDGGWRRMGRGGDSFWDKAKPSKVMESGQVERLPNIHWDDAFVDEIRQTFSACITFLLIPIFTLANGGMGNQLNDMSVAMTLNGVPNDLLSTFNAITIIAFTPIITYGFYPLMEKMGYPIRPMMRMCIGFLLSTVGCIFAAVIQDRVYKTSPCGRYATTCDEVSPVSLWWQLPPIFFPAVGELFVNVTSFELAYTRSPHRMKGLVFALALSNSAVASAISMACSKAIADPNLVIPWIVLAVASALCAILFPTYFKNLDDFDFQWSTEERDAIEARKTQPKDIEDSDKY